MTAPDTNGPRPLRRLPTFKPPDGAWDVHCHVFGPEHLFPYAPQRTYTPPDMPVGTLFALHRALGFSRAVLVQPAPYGSDHAAMRDALAKADGRYRGVMLVSGDGDTLDIDAEHAAGMRAVRYNLLPHLGATPDMGQVRAVAQRIAGKGWHVCLHTTPDGLADLPKWLDLGVPLVLDHLGRIDAGSPDASNQAEMLAEALGHGDLYIKLSGMDRASRLPAPYDDILPIARRLLAIAPERCLWGTDFPHPNHGAVPEDDVLVDLIPGIASTPDLQKLLLVDNPQRLYG